jgi:uncharacterized membrane protein YdjX (TVP38/TMEM64 family)
MSESPSPERLPILRLLAGIVAIIALLTLGRQLGSYFLEFGEWVNGLGWWGPLIFMAGYIAATVAFVPGSALTLTAGAIFGIVNGTVYVFIAATIGATAAFLVSRYVARQAIEARLQDDRRFAAIDRAVGREGFKIVLLLRLSPVFPFNLLNYALGLTGVRLRDYVLASAGMLPGTLVYIYSGKVAGDVARAIGGGTVGGAPYYAVLGLGFVATVIVTVLVTRTARRALNGATAA